jgi:sugar-specific transcriptional regulator TrmB
MSQQAQQGRLRESLRRVGLTAYESDAYLALLSKRELTAEEIAKMTSVPVTRVYGTLQQLMQKGFTKVVESRPKRFHAISPEQARREYLNHMRRTFDANLLSIEEVMGQLQKQIEPLYVESHLEVRPEELLEPLDDLRAMEKLTSEYIAKASHSILVSSALFSWLPKIKPQLKAALKRGVRIRVLMQVSQSLMGRHLAELGGLGCQVRETHEPWHPVRGTLIDDKDLVFVIWAAEESERYWNPIVYTPHHTKNQGLIRIFRESFTFRWNESKRITLGELTSK